MGEPRGGRLGRLGRATSMHGLNDEAGRSISTPSRPSLDQPATIPTGHLCRAVADAIRDRRGDHVWRETTGVRPS